MIKQRWPGLTWCVVLDGPGPVLIVKVCDGATLFKLYKGVVSS